MTNNVLTQRRNESLEEYVMRIKSMNSEEILNAAEQQRNEILNGYQKASKPSSYRRKVYHK